MHILVVHNPGAGLATHQEDNLLNALRDAGHEVDSCSSKDEFAVQGHDLVVIAGGDGTVEKVVRQLADTDIAFAIAPRGTANNIACSLGVEDISTTIAARWQLSEAAVAEAKYLSLGKVIYGHHEKLFTESVGCGLLTQLIAGGRENKAHRRAAFDSTDTELTHRVRTLQSKSLSFPPSRYELLLDGRDFSGEYLLVEILNLPRVGPALELTPEADPGAEVLDVVLVRHDEREMLSHYLMNVLQGNSPVSPFTRVRAKQVTVQCTASNVHIDDKCLNKDKWKNFEVQAGARRLRILN